MNLFSIIFWPAIIIVYNKLLIFHLPRCCLCVSEVIKTEFMCCMCMEGKIFRGGPRKKFRGSSLSIKNLKFQELNFDKCWGGGCLGSFTLFHFHIQTLVVHWGGLCLDRLFRGHSRVLVKELYCWHVLYILYRCIVMLFIRLLANKLKQMMKCVFYL